MIAYKQFFYIKKHDISKKYMEARNLIKIDKKKPA
jgi:hypothetical protein